MLELIRLVRERNARLILSGDTRQHGAVEASDALLAIERHSGVRPVELHKIRRQDPALAKDEDERTRIKQYRKAVESAAAGKMGDSFERLDKMGAIVACGLGEQADKLADEYSLKLGQAGGTLVGVIAIFGLISILSGLYLWWPRWRGLRHALTVKRDAGSVLRIPTMIPKAVHRQVPVRVIGE